MKIKSKIYAQLLLESLDSKTKLGDIAANFWNLLQKNKQYKELPKILTELEQLYAEKNGAKVVYLESREPLSQSQIETIKKQLNTKCKSLAAENILIKNILKDITGITAKIDNQVIDLSVEDKILRLRKKLAS